MTPTERRQSCHYVPASSLMHLGSQVCIVSSQVSAGKNQHAVCASGGTGGAEADVTPPWSSPAVGVRTRGSGESLFLLSL